MFRCGNTLIALAMLMAIPLAVSAQTADNPPLQAARRNRRANLRRVRSC